MILEGNFVDIHDIDSLEPSDLGLHDIPYIDDDWGMIILGSTHLGIGEKWFMHSS